ncbi:hypothetical protein [Altericroceibacterium xinjiangense]|uniref:hypothetical protein n=1 Tax=Altericroceibacterium xinjiangense TaxID=762261 RepID=UPI000F7F55EF|nr:hypothetical protein [Altericroceibacterium xinjiangense]
MRSLAIPAILILAGCNAEPAADRQTPAAPSPPFVEPLPSTMTPPRNEASGTQQAPAPRITSVGDLIGEYRVAGIDGEPLDAPIGIGLSIDEPLMSYEPTCAGFVWNIAFEGERLRTARNRSASDAAPGSAEPACTADVHPAKQRLAEALDAVTRAERDATNAVVLSGGGHRVMLYSQ